jgi:hypothetical protein
VPASDALSSDALAAGPFALAASPLAAEAGLLAAAANPAIVSRPHAAAASALK